jgi:hypothetical protein
MLFSQMLISLELKLFSVTQLELIIPIEKRLTTEKLEYIT